MKKIFILLFAFFLLINVTAQNKVPETIVDFKFSNDFVFGTDQYFTNGLQLRVYANFMSKSPANYILLPNSLDESIFYALTITHNIYTPTNLDTPLVQYHDEPYAAYLLIGSRKESYKLSKKLKKVSEFQLGILGPYAGGGFVQNTIHRLLPTTEPAQGWENQVANDLAIQYLISIEKGLINRDNFEMNVFVSGIVGNPHTEISSGMYIRAGLFEDYFEGPGLGYNKNLQLYIFGKGEITYVMYNAVLKGGLFHDGNLYNIGHNHHFLGHTDFGIAIGYKRVRIEVGEEILSSQFVGASTHLWGYARITFGI